ncbi:YihY/virulence factor BrkB family protein [Oligoflexus tunisiensis]|uniref:YihY/virulence factor BrkB family protein n=1 Tax=Oligoflexus tunisiensis TaxID=708132 RepID=UPI00159F2BC3|nr:YihY/virulence factor BrkB family protein [Oligoflexus tunisiensis]
MKDWKAFLKRIKDEVDNDRIGLIAAAVAYYALFSIFPLLIATVSIYGVFADPVDVARQMATLEQFMPRDALGVINNELNGIVQNSSGSLGFGAALSILITLWTASKGTKVLMEAMNIAYNEKEKRGFFRFNSTAVGLTLGAVITVVVAVASIAVLPPIMDLVGLGGLANTLIRVLRWPVLLLLFLTGLSILYRFGPSRDHVKWRWVSAGGLFTTLLILLASVGFAFYVEQFGSYNKTYGSLAGVVVLLLWFYIVSYAVLLGVELNAELEKSSDRGRPNAPPSRKPGLVVKTDHVPG